MNWNQQVVNVTVRVSSDKQSEKTSHPHCTAKQGVTGATMYHWNKPLFCKFISDCTWKKNFEIWLPFKIPLYRSCIPLTLCGPGTHSPKATFGPCTAHFPGLHLTINNSSFPRAHICKCFMKVILQAPWLSPQNPSKSLKLSLNNWCLQQRVS